MQFTGYLEIGDRRILVLSRVKSDGTGHYLKLRKSGKPSTLLKDESLYLAKNPDQLSRLLLGQTIFC